MSVGKPRPRSQIKTGIFCLESWSGDMRNKESVLPLLQLLERQLGLKFIHRVVDSKGSFFDLLEAWSRYGDYRLGYIACHGDEGSIQIGSDVVELEEFAKEVSRRGIRLAKRTLYFGSCATLRMPPKALAEFRSEIGAEAVCGYRGEDGVGWLESAAFELLLFDYLTHRYKTAPPALRDFKLRHAGFWKRVEFVADPIRT